MITAFSKDERIRVDLASIGLPEVSCIGVYEMTKAERCLSDEQHRDEMELVFVKRGEFSFPVAGTEYRVRAGEILVIQPGEAHGASGFVLERCIHYWMKFRVPAKQKSFLGLDAEMSKSVIHSLRTLPVRQFKASPRVGEMFEEILDILNSGLTDAKRLSLVSRILVWITLVVESTQQTPRAELNAEVDAAARWMRENPTEKFDVEGYADEVGTSSSRFRRCFREQMGVPVHDYFLEIKVEEARQMLANTDRTITEIAFALDFSSSQYFSTVFKRYTTLTPSAIRAIARPEVTADDADRNGSPVAKTPSRKRG